MAGKTVGLDNYSYDSQLEILAKWLSCNGEVWGIGPTIVFASAAALFLYHELEATILLPGDHVNVTIMEKTLISSMVIGMLSLMVHLWVCTMRFCQYYLDTLIKDSPSMLLEMTTVGLLGGPTEIVALGPLTRFLKSQQPQIHITFCWFLSLCYADYVRKNYCQRFNMPYLEQWQLELQERASRGFRSTMDKVSSFVGALHRRLRGYGPTVQNTETHTVGAHRYRAPVAAAACHERAPEVAGHAATQCCSGSANWRSILSASRARPLRRLLTNLQLISLLQDVRAVVRRTPTCAALAPSLQRNQRSLEELPQ